MTSDDHIKFYRFVGDHYEAKARREEHFARNCWEVAINLINAIQDSEHDGSGIKDLKKFAETKVSELEEALTEWSGRTMPITSTDSKGASE